LVIDQTIKNNSIKAWSFGGLGSFQNTAQLEEVLICIFVKSYKIVVRKGKFTLDILHSSEEFPLPCSLGCLAGCWLTVA
jgi:hypothetical protein